MALDDLGRWVPGGNDINPPVSGGQPASADEPPTPAPQAEILLRWRCLITMEAAMPELSDLNAPEFAPIKTRLARAYFDHKADIGAPHATDQDILDNVDDITALMLGALGRAMAERRHNWLQHYGWFTDLVIELLDDAPGKPLDG